ncbi:MAG TPA: phosphatase PAP2 family protein [Tepidisphaeraceae bacterium]|jgi:membrane-associated phospholipid phosphatase
MNISATMNLWIPLPLLAAAGFTMVLERRGVPTTLQLKSKGDIKRETQWLAQFGQATATVVAAVLIHAFEPAQIMKPVALLTAVFGTSLMVYVIKRLTGRVRPRREQAGQFLGPSLTSANWRESFPSSHSACATAAAVALSGFYPQAMVVFWALALVASLLRYLMDAHWPSDVLAGMAVGYLLSHALMAAFGF